MGEPLVASCAEVRAIATTVGEAAAGLTPRVSILIPLLRRPGIELSRPLAGVHVARWLDHGVYIVRVGSLKHQGGLKYIRVPSQGLELMDSIPLW